MIEGKRIRLRDLQVTDLEAALFWLHPSQKWHELDGPYYPPTPAEELPKMMLEWEKRIASPKPEPRERLVIADIENNAIMGFVSRYWISKETDWTAIGISIWNPDHWGKGYGYEALGYWCDYLFANEARFVRLDARTWSGNHGMMRLAEKLGFTKEAVFRKARIVNGDYYDGLGYGILREEWQALHPNGFSLTK
jgi:RimJ/RimL family protein N-acetyltransferase